MGPEIQQKHSRGVKELERDPRRTDVIAQLLVGILDVRYPVGPRGTDGPEVRTDQAARLDGEIQKLDKLKRKQIVARLDRVGGDIRSNAPGPRRHNVDKDYDVSARTLSDWLRRTGNPSVMKCLSLDAGLELVKAHGHNEGLFTRARLGLTLPDHDWYGEPILSIEPYTESDESSEFQSQDTVQAPRRPPSPEEIAKLLQSRPHRPSRYFTKRAAFAMTLAIVLFWVGLATSINGFFGLFTSAKKERPSDSVALSTTAPVATDQSAASPSAAETSSVPTQRGAIDTIPDEFDQAAPKRINWSVGTDYVTLNAAQGNPLEGDETNFLRLAEGQNPKYDVNTGRWSEQQLTYRLFVVNDAGGLYNNAPAFDGFGIARGTRLTLKIKEPKLDFGNYEMFARVSADNANPISVYDRITVSTPANQVVPSFVPGSAYLLTETGARLPLGDEVFSTGVLVGDRQLDGRVVAGVKRNFQVFFDVRYRPIENSIAMVHTLTTLDGGWSGPPGTIWRHKLVVTALGNAPTRALSLFFYSTTPVELVPGSVTLEGKPVTVDPFRQGLGIGTLESGQTTHIEFQTRSQGCDQATFSFAPSYHLGNSGGTKPPVTGETTSTVCSSTTLSPTTTTNPGVGDAACTSNTPNIPGYIFLVVDLHLNDPTSECFERSIDNVPAGATVKVRLRYANTSLTVQKNVYLGLSLPPGTDFVARPPFELRRGTGATPEPVQPIDIAKGFNTGDYLPGQGFEITGQVEIPERTCGIANMVLAALIRSGGIEREASADITVRKDCS